jgi:uroporphyrinogen-III synthase
MVAAGASRPIETGTGGARELWEQLRAKDSWAGRKVLVATVPGGRRELIDGLRSAGADVDEVECYTMRTRSADEIKRDWEAGRPDALLLASPSSVRQIADAIGVEAIKQLKAVIPIGRTTAAALSAVGISAEAPDVATFEAIVERLVAVRDQAEVNPSEAG